MTYRGPSLRSDDRIWILDLGNGENRFSPGFLDAVENALDEVLLRDGPSGLLTIGFGRFFSNGLDLDWLEAHPGARIEYAERVHSLLSRVLTLPLPSVAAINGHAFGAGAMLAMAHDYRVMRTDRGYVCFPEVDIDLHFTEGMAALIQAKVTPRTAVDSMTTGRRYDGPAAVTAGLVDAVTSAEELEAAADSMIRDLTHKRGSTLGQIKATMFASAVRALALPLA